MNQPMNREQKRMLQRRGQVGADGAPVAAERTATTRRPGEARVSPTQFVREVNGELRKVAWPSRAETMNYSAVVLMTLVILVAGIFGIDYLCAKSALFLFK